MTELSCSCNYDDWDGDERWEADDFKPLNTKRARKCKSCGKKINIGDEALAIFRHRRPNWTVEENIYGEECDVPMATWYHCERCGELFLNLLEYNYCVQPDDNMEDMLKEHWKLTGFTPKE